MEMGRGRQWDVDHEEGRGRDGGGRVRVARGIIGSPHTHARTQIAHAVCLGHGNRGVGSEG